MISVEKKQKIDDRKLVKDLDNVINREEIENEPFFDVIP